VLQQLAASESSGGGGVEFRFVREIVYPSGHREVEGTTPKALPAPDAAFSPMQHARDMKIKCVQSRSATGRGQSACAR
jgi:hypothetical protein